MVGLGIASTETYPSSDRRRDCTATTIVLMIQAVLQTKGLAQILDPWVECPSERQDSKPRTPCLRLRSLDPGSPRNIRQVDLSSTVVRSTRVIRDISMLTSDQELELINETCLWRTNDVNTTGQVRKKRERTNA